jgi:hypothetical protein
MSEQRIYVIVAETVQNPLQMEFTTGGAILKPTADTKTIVQPMGRIGAQIGHVTSKMRMARMFGVAIKSTKVGLKRKPMEVWVNDMEPLVNEAITTIVLAVPDSYQLEFRHNLIRKNKINVYDFRDTNAVYGVGSVKTAICTEPVDPAQLFGATDYLELWK